MAVDYGCGLWLWNTHGCTLAGKSASIVFDYLLGVPNFNTYQAYGKS